MFLIIKIKHIMGLMNDSIWSVCRGKREGFVVYRRLGQTCVRSLTNSRASIGARQVEQQERIASLAVFFRALGSAGLKECWQRAEKPRQWNGYNLFVHRNIGAFTGEGTIGDFGKVELTAGRLSLPDNIRLRQEGERWVMEWENLTELSGDRGNDRMQVALMEGREDGFTVKVWGEWRDGSRPEGGKREEGRLAFRLPTAWRGYGRLYCFMRSENGGEFSPSRYMGQREDFPVGAIKFYN